ncbi:MAG: KEOPS complex subunit Pcc1 [Candidatus Thermoplasmatota archaeon]
MKVKCKIKIEFKSKEEARNVNEVLKIDNEKYISTKVNGKFIEAEIEANKIMSIIHTLDDFFSCLKEAIEIFTQI